jgi:hypothetical protein
MSEITIEALEAKHSELAALIEQFKAAPKAKLLTLNRAVIELRPGEQYAGPVLDQDGTHLHHLVLMAEVPEKPLNWQAATAWAESIGGQLPTRQEQALLFANCKPHLKAAWHWSSEMHADDASYAWGCVFLNGGQLYGHKSFEACARAVRRV